MNFKLIPINQDNLTMNNPDESFYQTCKEYLGLSESNNEINHQETQGKIESLKNLELLPLDIGKKAIFIQNSEKINQINYNSLPESIYLSQESQLIMEIFNISPNCQKFFYKGKRIYEVSSLIEISQDDPIYLMEISQNNISVFKVNIKNQNSAAFDVPVQLNESLNIFQVLLEFRKIYDVKDTFRNEVYLYNSDNKILEFDSPVPEDLIIKIVPNFNINPQNYVVSYNDIRNIFSFDISFELQKLKYQSAIFFKLNPNTIEFYHDDISMTEDVNFLNNSQNENIDVDIKSKEYENSECIKGKVRNYFNINTDEDIASGLNLLGECENCGLENKSFLLGFGGFDILNMKKTCFQCEGRLKLNSIILLKCYARCIYATFCDPRPEKYEQKIIDKIMIEGNLASNFTKYFLEVDELLA